MRILSWFSCGVASAVASKLALNKFGNDCEVIYCNTNSEHEDNKRFLLDIEKWLDRKIIILKSEKYNNTWDVFEKTRYLVGNAGARCTTELKKKLRFEYQQPGDLHIFGYSLEEKFRVKKLIANNPELEIEFPLIDNKLTKKDCLALISEQGIETPTMYKLGYKNNNCVGCVKGGAGYWNKIRVDFPEVFNRMAKVERELGVTILKDQSNKNKGKRIYLDELSPSFGNYKTEPNISCGLECQTVNKKINY